MNRCNRSPQNGFMHLKIAVASFSSTSTAQRAVNVCMCTAGCPTRAYGTCSDDCMLCIAACDAQDSLEIDFADCDRRHIFYRLLLNYGAVGGRDFSVRRRTHRRHSACPNGALELLLVGGLLLLYWWQWVHLQSLQWPLILRKVMPKQLGNFSKSAKMAMGSRSSGAFPVREEALDLRHWTIALFITRNLHVVVGRDLVDSTDMYR